MSDPQREECAPPLEDSADDLYENAPCGYLSTLPDGTIVKINGTLLDWLGRRREDVVGRLRFTDLLTVGGRLYHETHYAPLLHMQGRVGEIALELATAGGGRLPVLVASVVKHSAEGTPALIRTMISDARARRAYEAELLRARREAEEAHRAAEVDRARLQQVVATLQSSLLPPSLPAVPGLTAVAHYQAASPDNLGGDFYDLFSLGGERWAFFLGDVVGKGPEAAAVTSLARYTLRAAAMHDPAPAKVLATLDTVLNERHTGEDPRYCTVIAGSLSPGDGTFGVELASGGHPPALLLRADGEAAYLPTTGGLVVGLLPTATFISTGVVLRPGDTLLLYTDGLTEARTGKGDERFGDAALLDLARRLAPATARETVAAIVDLLHGFGDGLEDDAALLALGVPA
ncbi:SpoIIE family protein phosphatase [Spongiactinospora sp. TRM90649]|uniref:PP2C family protein-serine/threonine phosphatase n=1 Tax=Spongiactinospora sp. TRM90649 TaxID=3031114 RepID=UPI0023F9BA04|nr:SpoIIE family protein phosphatase [Spongiactinospora sp. TRM90649]MDF5759161.1 SpoIIE family protein phosphatase [Spongiactinospora sp. TRM90649]